MESLRNSPEWQTFRLDQIKPCPGHARRHGKRQLEKLKRLIRHFGQVVPIVVDPAGVIIDGHAVWTAMRELGSGEISAVVVANRTDPEIKALRLALNRIPADAAWDNDRLRIEVEDLVKLSFDLDLTGFDAVEIDQLLEIDVPKLNVTEDGDQIPVPKTPAITTAGDIWVCGRHRIGCGDARDHGFVEKLTAGVRAAMCFVDPPYNIPVAGFVSGKGRVQHREFVQGVGELSTDQFTKFLADSLIVLQQSAADGALLYACMDWRHIFELLAAGRQCDLDLFNLCVWAKTNAGMGSLYRSQHELICVFKVGTSNNTNNVELGRHGRNRSNLWTYRGLNSFGADREQQLASHPTVKPVLMIADAVRDVTRRGDAVLDTFLGSGSTIMAAEETGRIGIGADLDPLYVDVAVQRWQARTRCDARHAETGELFDDRVKRLASQHQEQHRDQQEG
jgi:DNA modification methylase